MGPVALMGENVSTPDPDLASLEARVARLERHRLNDSAAHMAEFRELREMITAQHEALGNELSRIYQELAKLVRSGHRGGI